MIGALDGPAYGISAEKVAGYNGFPVASAMRQPQVRDPKTTVPAAAIWLLQCLIHCTQKNGGAALKDIIAFGDFINHAVFEYREFSVALGYLSANHIAYVRRGRVFLTKNFKSAFSFVAMEQERPAYGKEYAELEKFLCCLQPVNGIRRPRIGKKVFAAAVLAYLKPEKI